MTALTVPLPRAGLAAAARSAALAGWLRYRRSWGLWLFLILGPVGARYMVADEAGNGVHIRIGDALPLVTSPVLGVWLGVVVATMLLPVAWIYLRAATNRRHPAAVVDVTGASRMGISLGRFAADAAVLLLALAALTLAGFILAFAVVSGPIQPWPIARNLWIIAAPILVAVAGVRQLFAGLPFLRGGWGDFAFFWLWIASMGLPMSVGDQPSSYATNLRDPAGFVRPLMGPEPVAGKDFAIGHTDLAIKRKRLDPDPGIFASGYLPARLSWLVAGPLLALLGGLVYRPAAAPRRRAGLLAKLRTAPPPRPANPLAPPAGRARLGFVRLVASEARLVLAGRLLPWLAAALALLGLVGDFRHAGSPATLLLLLLVASAHAGRSEARGFERLTATTAFGRWPRRAALLAAITLLALAMAVPAALAAGSAQPLLLGAQTGLVTALVAIALAAFSGSATAPRVVLLILWYGYFSS